MSKAQDTKAEAEEETVTFYLRNQKEDREDDTVVYKLEASSNDAKLIAIANEMSVCAAWRFGDGPFNPCQGGDEEDVAYVPTTARTPAFVDHPVFGCCRIVVYNVFDDQDELIGKLYIGMHA